MSDVKILLVEDNTLEAMDIKRTLESFGYSVLYVANSGEEAVLKALELMPDLVLMDIILNGEEDGIYAASEIKKLKIPVIYLTAHSEEPIIQKAKLTGPYGYILKPYNPLELKYAISIALHKKSEEIIRINAENEVKKANLYNRGLIEASLDPLVTIGPNGKITDANKATEKATGHPRDKLIGTDFSDYFTKPNKARKGYQQVFKEGFVRDFHLEIKHKDGGLTPVLYNATTYKDESGEVVGVFAAARDVKALKQIKDIIQARFRLLECANSHSMDELLAATLDEIEELTGSTMGFYVFLESDQRTLSLQNWSTNTLKMCGAEGKGLHYDISEAGVWVDCVYEGGPVIHNDYASLPHRKGLPEGHVPIIREVTVPIFRGNLIKAIIGVANKSTNYDENDVEILSQLGDLSWDIVEGKKTEEELKLADLYNRSLIEASLDPLVTIGPNGKITDANKATEKATGHPRDKLIGTDFSDYFTKPNKARKGYQQVFKEGFVRDYPLEIKNKNGQIIPVLYNASVYKDESNRIVGVFAAARDITKQKLAEREEERLNRELQAIIHCNQTMLRAVDEQTLLNDICSIICNEAGYSLAWVGYADHNDAKTIRPVAKAGYDNGYVENAKLSWSEDAERGQGPGGIVIRSGEIVYVQDFLIHPLMAPWREKTLRHGYRSGIALPLKDKKARTFGALLIYSSKPNAISPDEIRIMGGLADNLAFGIVSLREQKHLQKAEEKIQMLANVVESSDDAIITKSLDGTITSWNKGAEVVYGYSEEEVLGKNISILAPPQLKDELKHLTEKIEAGEHVLHYETLRVRKDEKEINISITLSPIFDSSENLVGISTIARDVTQRKKAENAILHAKEEWENTFDAVPDLIAILDTDYHVVRANRSMANRLSADPEETVGLTCYDVVHGSNAPPSFCPYIKLLEDGQEHTAEVHEDILGGDFIVSVSPLYDADGNLTGGVHVARDITQRKMAEDEVKRSLKEKEVLLSEVHHRVKNNMQIITSLLSLQAGYLKDEKAISVLKESQDRVKAMAIIYEKLYQSHDLTSINFAEYIENLLKSLFYSHATDEEQIKPIIEIEDVLLNIETAIPCGLIISELVSNSLKHAFPKGNKGEVHVSLKTQPNGYELTISDNGVGFPEEIDFKNTNTLGLQLVYSLINQIEGKTTLKKKPGTEFKILFKELDYKKRF